ncbi:MAG TPA: hypothetical protein PJ982_08205, partial [Lacipirellulaceae bacterium]|nr:hypothetical protein [Lacipirellulaceae bacterium]
MAMHLRQLVARVMAVCAILAGALPAAGYHATTRWNTTATNGFIGFNSWGTPTTVTWSLAPDGTFVDASSTSNLIAFMDGIWGAGDGGYDPVLGYSQRPWFHLFESSFARLRALSGVTYVYEPKDDGVSTPRAFSNAFNARGQLGVRGDVRIGGKAYTGEQSNTLATNYFPDHGDMIIGTHQGTFFSAPGNNFRGFRNTIMHEALHGLGVSHIVSTGSRFLIEPFISTVFDGPQLDDILALHRLYGDVLEKNGGNDTYATATPLGQVAPGQSVTRGTLGDNTVVDGSAIDFLSIDGASDVDYFSFTLDDEWLVTLDVAPKGTTYSIRRETETTEYPYNSQALNNLTLALFDPTG